MLYESLKVIVTREEVIEEESISRNEEDVKRKIESIEMEMDRECLENTPSIPRPQRKKDPAV